VVAEERPVLIQAAVLLDHERDLPRPLGLRAEQREGRKTEVAQSAVEVW
jgi:hypothetical protein